MSVKVSSWVWHETSSEVKGGQLVVLLALADIADDEGRCIFTGDTSQAALAAKARMSVSQFRAVTKRLEESGLLESERESRTATKSYRIVVTAGNRRSESAVAPPRTGGRSSYDVLNDSDQVDALFDAFWSVYPRRVGKAAARSKFVALGKSGTDLDAVVAGARVFAADPNLPEKQFVPHPTTWLNQGRWEDEPLPPRDGAPAGPPSGPRSPSPVEAAVPEEIRARLAERRVPVEEYFEERHDPAWRRAYLGDLAGVAGG